MTTKFENVYPRLTNPYYIVTPPWERTSAGIKALHILCHNLNLKGYPAYLIITDRDHVPRDEDLLCPDFLTPRLTRLAAKTHYEEKRVPIVVYSEIISGNPLAGPAVLRYVLNFPGLLGGDKVYDESELCFGYSKVLAQAAGAPDNILFIPTSNTNIFHPAPETQPREGSCFYASKYQKVHGGVLFDITRDSVEITRQPSDQTPEIIADLFRKSEVFYAYENTALATEAALCGCPVVFLPNPHLESIIASEELGSDGYAWGADEAELARARATVPKAFENYQNTIRHFYEQLENLISQSQALSHARSWSEEQYARLDGLLSEDLYLLNEPKLSALAVKEQQYGKLLRRAPWWLERRIGEFLCTLGLTRDGSFLWNRANSKFVGSVGRVVVEQSSAKEYAAPLKKLPWQIEQIIGKLLINAGLTRDGLYLVHRANARCSVESQSKNKT